MQIGGHVRSQGLTIVTSMPHAVIRVENWI